ncbi:MAG: hypothetical protein FJ009_15390 [Chloroflexi bacterium]|nr:hypothetical protein [Chloroflexota bacterium]
MKKMPIPKSHTANEMRAEYRFDYRKARPNRFAARSKDRVVVTLDPDVSKIFKTPEAVNNALRAFIAAIPQTPKRKAA